MLPLLKQTPFYPGQWGIPGSDMPLGIRTTPETMVFYVSSGHPEASDDNDGTDPFHPLATIDHAIGHCTAGHFDQIRVAPGHLETLTTAAQINLDISGAQIIGEGFGQLRPRLNFTNIAATVAFTAANCSIRNCLFLVGVDALPVMADINADDAGIFDCEFRENTAVAQQWLTAIDINGGGANAADRAQIIGNKFVSEAAGANHAIEIGAVEDGVVISGNWITGDYAVAGVHSASVLTNLLLLDNNIRNTNAGDFAVELSAAATGMAVGNRFYTDSPATCFDPGSLMCADNLAVNAVDQSATPIPAAAGVMLVERCIEKADGTTPLGQDDLFVVSGGPVLATGLWGLCTVDVGGAANCHLDHAVTDPVADIALSTDVAVGALISGGSISFTDVALPVLTPTAAGAVVNPGKPQWFLPAGTLKAHFSAAQAGTWRWFMTYKPLSPNSVVTAAA